jgi:hypothetical protein
MDSLRPGSRESGKKSLRRPKLSTRKFSAWTKKKKKIAALHVSGFTITHLQEHKTTVTTASGNCYTALLSAAIVEELEPV